MLGCRSTSMRKTIILPTVIPASSSLLVDEVRGVTLKPMPGIESFNRRKSNDDSDDLRVAEQLRALYRRALIALNQYITVKLGVGKAPVAGLLLNYIFADEVLSPDDSAIA